MLSADLGWKGGREQPNAHWGGNSWVFSGQRCRESCPRMLQQAAAVEGPAAPSPLPYSPLRLLPGTFFPKAQPGVSCCCKPL